MKIPGLDAVRYTHPGYWAYMALRWGLGRRELPRIHPVNTVLKSQAEADSAVAEAARLKLPPFSDRPKTWDTLGALHEVVSRNSRDARVLDAGAEIYSRILPWLYLYGFRRLTGINLVFPRPIHHGPIRYEYGDITATQFNDAYFDAITCLSVIEHGVDLRLYFKEMARILKPGGVLVTSTDYFEQPTDTRGQSAYGVPIRIFTRDDITAAFEIAREYGLELTQPADLTSRDRVVHWKIHDLRYSFIIFSMTRR
jgi:SAM-dependent methyltransferase